MRSGALILASGQMVENSARVTKDNYFTQIHANIFNLLNNRSNVPDPVDTSGNRKFVYVREPNYMALNFERFPFIVVPDPETSQGNKVSDASKAFQDESFEIIIMTSDKVSDSDGHPLGAQQMRDIKTNIKKTLDDLSNSRTLRNNGLRNKTYPSITNDWGEVDGKPIHRTEISLRFSNQLRVIA